jgi:hypothetical protein
MMLHAQRHAVVVINAIFTIEREDLENVRSRAHPHDTRQIITMHTNEAIVVSEKLDLFLDRIPTQVITYSSIV